MVNTDTVNFKKGDIIVTYDGILGIYDYETADEYGTPCFMLSVANNIDDNIWEDFKCRKKGARLATEDEKKKLIKLAAKKGIILKKKEKTIYFN